ncbi:hypothetical protein [Carnobacterium mobile]|uniref:hypothetical protein n=1 Tax=Carnobacterium mobile TaxID=2750 RepID=UPI00054D7D78|nr:hypothetical protein [Carnobacterium mobile]
MKQFVHAVFTSLQLSYFIRQYVFSGMIAALVYFGINRTPSFDLLLILNFLLYPFAMFAYDSLIHLLLGNTVWIMSGLWSLIYGALKRILIFFFSTLIAPIGMLLLYFMNRKREN